jgi:hypothetical protein
LYRKLTILLAFVLTLLLLNHFIIEPRSYEVTLTPPVLRASENSELVIEVSRFNLLGFTAPFSKTDVIFSVIDGGNLIYLQTLSSSSAKVRSRGIEGEVIIKIALKETQTEITKVLVKILPKELA